MKKLPFKSATFNPLDFIHRNDPATIDHCNDFAETLVVKTEGDTQPFWNMKAQSCISTILALTVYSGGKNTRSIHDVISVIGNPQRLPKAINMAMEDDNGVLPYNGILQRKGSELKNLYTQIRMKDGTLSPPVLSDEGRSVISVALRHTNCFSTPLIEAATRSSSFDPSGLKKKKMSIYLVIPPAHAKANEGVMRMLVSSLVRSVVQCGASEKRLVHLILDEAHTLKGLNTIPEAVARYRKYGIRAQIFVQDEIQLEDAWKEQAQVILNCSALVCFGTNGQEQAKRISERLGNKTQLVEGWNEGQSRGGNNGGSVDPRGMPTSSWGSNNGTSSGNNWAQQIRPLATPDEVLRAHQRVAFVWPPFMAPLITCIVPYFAMPSLYRRKKGAFGLTLRVFGQMLVALAMFSMVALGLMQLGIGGLGNYLGVE